MFILFSPENWHWLFTQIVLLGDSLRYGALHVRLFTGKNTNNTNLSSAEFVQRVLKTTVVIMNLSAWLTKTNPYWNSVDPDETAHMSRLIRIYAVCYSSIDFWLIPHLCINWSVQIQRRNSPLQKSGMKGSSRYRLASEKWNSASIADTE